MDDNTAFLLLFLGLGLLYLLWHIADLTLTRK